LIALDGDQIVGVARYAANAGDPTSADISLLVVDDLQRHGVARELLGRLETLARERGIRVLTASVLGENRQARGLLFALHPQISGRFERGAYTYRYEIAGPSLAPGQRSSLTLQFSAAGPVAVSVPVQ
jgi:GNAT superfamily N-acetyltransferase